MADKGSASICAPLRLVGSHKSADNFAPVLGLPLEMRQLMVAVMGDVNY